MPELFPYQDEAVQWLLAHPRSFLALEQGLGKTAVSATEAHPPVLVVCPASLKLNWLRELQNWRPDLRSHVIRKAADPIPDCDALIVNYELISKGPIMKHLKTIDFQTAIFDESHYLKTATTKRTKAARAIIKRTPRIRLLSGTPVVNRPIELFPMLKALNATKLDYMSFARRYCAGWDAPWGFDVSGASNLDELYEHLSPIMLRLTKRQVLPQLPSKTYRVIELDLPIPQQEKALRADQIQRGDHSVPFEAIANILKFNAERKLPLAIEHIKNLLEHEQKVVVFAWHSDIIEAIQSSLADFSPVVLTGSTPLERRQEAVDKFQQDPKTRVFVGNIKAAGVGITLTQASRAVFVECTWSPADIEQAADRLHRIGQTDPVNIDILTIHKSVDAQQLHAIISKLQVINRLVKENEMTDNDLLNKLASIRDQIDELIQSSGADFSPKVSGDEQAPERTSLDDVRIAAKEAIDATSVHKVQKVLSNFGAQKVSDLDKADYAQVVKALGMVS